MLVYHSIKEYMHDGEKGRHLFVREHLGNCKVKVDEVEVQDKLKSL